MVIEFNMHGNQFKLIPTKFGCDIFCNGTYNNTILQEQEYDHEYWIGRGIEYAANINLKELKNV